MIRWKKSKNKNVVWLPRIHNLVDRTVQKSQIVHIFDLLKIFPDLRLQCSEKYLKWLFSTFKKVCNRIKAVLALCAWKMINLKKNMIYRSSFPHWTQDFTPHLFDGFHLSRRFWTVVLLEKFVAVTSFAACLTSWEAKLIEPTRTCNLRWFVTSLKLGYLEKKLYHFLIFQGSKIIF